MILYKHTKARSDSPRDIKMSLVGCVRLGLVLSPGDFGLSPYQRKNPTSLSKIARREGKSLL